MTIQDDFRAEIESFLERHDMKPAVFGQQALHDPKFVFDLRQGRSPSVKTIEKVRAWMAAQDAGEGTAAVTEAQAGEVPPAEPVEAAASRRHGARNALVALVVLALLVAGAAAVWQRPLISGLYHRMAGDPGAGQNRPAIEQFSAVVAAVQNDFNALRRDLRGLRDRIERLEEQQDEAAAPAPAMDDERLAMLEERLTALENRPAATATPAPALSPGDVAELRNRIDRLQESVARLQARQQELAALDGRVTALKDELDSLTSGVSDISGLQAGIEQSAVISAFLRLDAEVRSGQPYAAALSLYQKQVQSQAGQGDWPTGEALEGQAAAGIATAPALRDRLEALIPDILGSRETGDGWSDRLWSRLKGIVVVRRTGEPQGDTPQAIIARAETRLAAGDLAGAVAEVESLPADRKAAAANSQRYATALLAALDTLADMATALGNAQGS
jgi:hypothetical protein